MNNNGKGRDIFFGVVALATLIVAIIGATLAYFSITASSNEGAVNATAKVVSINYEDGQQVTAQANELIPAKFDVVKKSYEAIFARDEKVDPEKNLCVDSKDQQVCSVYRFSVTSDAGIYITATLKNEHNGFEDLKYAIYQVGAEDSEKGWVTLVPGQKQEERYLALNRCMNDEKDATACTQVTEGSTLKEYNDIALNSLFGFKQSGTETIKQSVWVEGTQTFDLVLFLYDTETNQNAQQGQSYNGTISVDIDSADGENISGIIYEDDEYFNK